MEGNSSNVQLLQETIEAIGYKISNDKKRSASVAELNVLCQTDMNCANPRKRRKCHKQRKLHIMPKARQNIIEKDCYEIGQLKEQARIQHLVPLSVAKKIHSKQVQRNQSTTDTREHNTSNELEYYFSNLCTNRRLSASQYTKL
eukprot:368239_1